MGDEDDAELRELRLLKAKMPFFQWTEDHPVYKRRMKAIQKKYMLLAKEESKSKGGKVKAPGQKMNKFVWSLACIHVGEVSLASSTVSHR